MALFALINWARKLNGWSAKDARDLEPQMLVWFETFQRYAVPVDAYKEIFDMAFDVRIDEMGKGKVSDAPLIDAALLVSCYTRKHGIRDQREQRRIESGRILTDVAASQCQRCEGLNMEAVYDDNGNRLGLKKGCDHRPIIEGEGLAVYFERISSRRPLRAVG